MSAPSRPSTTFGVSTRDGRDPLGYAVAAMNKLAQSELLDRLGIRKHTERAVFTVTRGGFRTATTAGRAFASAGKRGRAGTRPGAAPARGVFDLTPTEDEQMLVDVVTELATEVVRPAAADADTACATPPEVLAAGNEIGLPILGVPESLGGLSDERTAMTGTLVAEALAQGDLGIAVATLAQRLGRHRAVAVGDRRAAGDVPPGVHGRSSPPPPPSPSPSRPSCSTPSSRRPPPRPAPTATCSTA